MQSQFDITRIKEKIGFSVWIYVLVIDCKQDVVGWRIKYLEIIAVIKTGSIRKLGNFTCFMFHFSVSPVSYFRFCGTTACQVTAVEQVFQVFSFSFYPIWLVQLKWQNKSHFILKSKLLSFIRPVQSNVYSILDLKGLKFLTRLQLGLIHQMNTDLDITFMIAWIHYVLLTWKLKILLSTLPSLLPATDWSYQ